jgi:hypothetical protein
MAEAVPLTYVKEATHWPAASSSLPVAAVVRKALALAERVEAKVVIQAAEKGDAGAVKAGAARVPPTTMAEKGAGAPHVVEPTAVDPAQPAHSAWVVPAVRHREWRPAAVVPAAATMEAAGAALGTTIMDAVSTPRTAAVVAAAPHTLNRQQPTLKTNREQRLAVTAKSSFFGRNLHRIRYEAAGSRSSYFVATLTVTPRGWPMLITCLGVTPPAG